MPFFGTDIYPQIIRRGLRPLLDRIKTDKNWLDGRMGLSAVAADDLSELASQWSGKICDLVTDIHDDIAELVTLEEQRGGCWNPTDEEVHPFNEARQVVPSGAVHISLYIFKCI